MAGHVFFNPELVRHPAADSGVAHLGYVILTLRGQRVAVSSFEIHYGE
jgi:hypothetical protein